MMRPWSFAREEVGTVSGFAFLVLTMTILGLSPRAADITNRLYDPIRNTPARNEVVIVGIDDKSLQAIGAWPWDRSVFSTLSSRLDMVGVKVTAYDVLFLEPRSGDEQLLETLVSAQYPIILAAKLDGNSYLSSHLVDSASTSVVSVSLANVEPDKDGKVRSYPQPYLANSTCIRGLAESAFLRYSLQPKESCDGIHGLFRYPENVVTYSLVDVLEGNVPPENLKGKVVFVGATAPELEDNFIGLNGNKIPGVLVHASIFTSLMNGVRDVPLSSPAMALSIVIAMLVSAFLVYRVKNVSRQAMVIVVVLLVCTTAAVIAFSYGIQLPLASYIVSILVSSGYVIAAGFMLERRKNAYIESIFSKYVHKDVLDELISSRGELKLGGERKEISILFSDIRGFTSISESLSPEKLTTLLNAYLSAMTPQILNEKGTVDKFIGDAIMAFWNAPLKIDGYAERAVRSGLGMLDTLKDFNRVHGTELRIGIGIHKGEAIVGNVGGADRVNYTALGDTVNLASRLEGLTKKYGVDMIVTKAVRDAVTDERIVFRCLDVVTVLGKATPTTLYEPKWKHEADLEFIGRYERALKHYFHKEWKEAENELAALSAPDDHPVRILRERIHDLRTVKDWDGIWKWDEK